MPSGSKALYEQPKLTDASQHQLRVYIPILSVTRLMAVLNVLRVSLENTHKYYMYADVAENRTGTIRTQQ